MGNQSSFHFSFGNSSYGPVGFCARVTAATPAEAVAILKEVFNDAAHGISVPVASERVEYIEIYINPEYVTEAGIDEAEDESGEKVTAPARAESEIESLLQVISTLVSSLDDASSVVGPGEGEKYAYQAELELGRATLKKYDRG